MRAGACAPAIESTARAGGAYGNRFRIRGVQSVRGRGDVMSGNGEKRSRRWFVALAVAALILVGLGVHSLEGPTLRAKCQAVYEDSHGQHRVCP